MLENDAATEKLIQLLEPQLTNAHQQNQEFSQKLDQAFSVTRKKKNKSEMIRFVKIFKQKPFIITQQT